MVSMNWVIVKHSIDIDKIKLEEMEGNGDSAYGSIAKKSELETLQKEHEEKMQKIQHLKTQIETVKLNLEKKRKEVSKEKPESFKTLSAKYNSMREEYNALVAERLKK